MDNIKDFEPLVEGSKCYEQLIPMDDMNTIGS